MRKESCRPSLSTPSSSACLRLSRRNCSLAHACTPSGYEMCEPSATPRALLPSAAQITRYAETCATSCSSSGSIVVLSSRSACSMTVFIARSLSGISTTRTHVRYASAAAPCGSARTASREVVRRRRALKPGHHAAGRRRVLPHHRVVRRLGGRHARQQRSVQLFERRASARDARLVLRRAQCVHRGGDVPEDREEKWGGRGERGGDGRRRRHGTPALHRRSGRSFTPQPFTAAPIWPARLPHMARSSTPALLSRALSNDECYESLRGDDRHTSAFLSAIAAAAPGRVCLDIGAGGARGEVAVAAPRLARSTRTRWNRIWRRRPTHARSSPQKNWRPRSP